jgi:hypothetical protein
MSSCAAWHRGLRERVGARRHHRARPKPPNPALSIGPSPRSRRHTKAATASNLHLGMIPLRVRPSLARAWASSARSAPRGLLGSTASYWLKTLAFTDFGLENLQQIISDQIDRAG